MAKCIKLNPSDDDQAIKHELKKISLLTTDLFSHFLESSHSDQRICISVYILFLCLFVVSVSVLLYYFYA